MKFSTLAALSSSCALLAIAQPVVQDKRAVVYETYVTEVVQTEYEFVTVWVTPGQNAVQEAKTTSSSSQHNHEDYHINLKSSSSSVTPAAVSVAPVSVTPVSVTPVSVTPVSVTPVSVTPVEVSVTPVSVTPVEVSVTPVSFSPVQVSVTPVSVTPVSVTPVSVTPVSVTPVVEQPAPTSTAATNNYGTTTGGGACNEIGGHCAGDATFYDVYPDQWTACGTHVDGLKEDIFAIAEGMMPGNANTSPQCGRKAVIEYNGKKAYGTLVDKCPGCGGNGIDLSHHLFDQLCDESKGRIQVTWSFLS